MYRPANDPRVTPLADRLAVLGAELRLWRPFWSAHAFREPVLPWEAGSPDLARALRSLDADQVRRLAQDARALDDVLRPWFPVDRWCDLEAVEVAEPKTQRPWPHGFDRDIPGRKWEQVRAFSAALERGPSGTVVDWCAGKAHLGRAIAFQWQTPELFALERDPRLVDAAHVFARRHGLPLRAHVCDVLGPGVEVHLAQASQLVALHACGALHRRLLEAGMSARVPAIDCAPCCYHLGPAGHLPLSALARRHDPLFRPADLRTAVQEEVTAGGHARRRRERLQTWQLGCDALLREHAGQAGYTVVRGARAGMLAGDFEGYCQHVARVKGIFLPEGIPVGAFEARGQVRFREVSALDLVRRRFRRLIELWLLTDLAVSLEEAGYAVRLLRFCAASITPRNLLLQARLAA